MKKVPVLIPVTDLRQDAAKALEKVNQSSEPVVITQRGRAAAVMLGVEQYETLRREREILELLARGEKEIASNEGYDFEDVLRVADELLDQDAT